MTTGHFVADVEPGIGVGILLGSVCSISQIPWPFKLSQMLGPGGLVNIRDAFAVRLASNNCMLRLDFGGHFSLICHLTMPHLRENWAEEHFVNFCVENQMVFKYMYVLLGQKSWPLVFHFHFHFDLYGCKQMFTPKDYPGSSQRCQRKKLTFRHDDTKNAYFISLICTILKLSQNINNSKTAQRDSFKWDHIIPIS